MRMSRPVYRFAPSPNGLLHLGHAYSALLNADLAEARGGRLLLRIEDIDLARCRPEFEAAIRQDLAWLGFSWEEPVRRQSEHFDAYSKALGRLVADGIAYPSFMTRAEIAASVAARAARGAPWPRDPDGAPLYPGAEREMSGRERKRLMASGLPYAWRLDMAAALAGAGALFWRESGAGPRGETGSIPADAAAWGDVVLARKDVPASYHLCVTLDDAIQGVTDVVRGHDLFHATSVHRLLQNLLGLPEPAYRHHALVLDTDGRKLSKSRRSTAIAALRDAGETPRSLRARIDLPAIGSAAAEPGLEDGQKRD